jgi:chemotaxis signal transduction protein
MRYFICPLDNALLGIPEAGTERIIPVTRQQAVVSETEEGQAFISLPALFRQKQTDTPRGLVLKGGAEPQTVLLSPKIDIDMEIPEEDIRKLPKAIADLFPYFTGVYFSDQGMILILDPEKLKA